MPRTVIGAKMRSARRRHAAIVLAASACGSGAATVLAVPAFVHAPLPTPRGFAISGAPPALVPGRPAPLDLTLSNPNAFPVRVRAIVVAVAERTSLAGCDGTTGFRTSALVGPVDLPARTTATLSALGVAEDRLPTVTALTGADGCGHARITLRYAGRAGS
jgi:hypothetical protein